MRDAPSESSPAREIIIEVDRVSVAGQFGESFDIVRRDRLLKGGAIADFQSHKTEASEDGFGSEYSTGGCAGAIRLGEDGATLGQRFADSGGRM
jgi:hypothetical protein